MAWIGNHLRPWPLLVHAPSPPYCEVALNDREIRFLKDGVVQASVHRDRVRYVSEWNGGKRLVISEYSGTWTRLVGPAIGIPRTLQEYDEVKMQALGWLHANAARK